MPSSLTHRAQCLDRIGVTEDDMQALERIWNTETFRLIADIRSGALADWGYSAVDALDAIWHELEEATAHLYMQHGFTPHQAFLLATDRQAQVNLWGPSIDTDRVHHLLGSSLPRDLLVKVLLTAATPQETDARIAECSADGADAEAALTSIESQGSPLAGRVDACDCA